MKITPEAWKSKINFSDVEPEKRKHALRECPFCHERTDLKIDRRWGVCGSCGTLGPTGEDRADAERLWNTRSPSKQRAEALELERILDEPFL